MTFVLIFALFFSQVSVNVRLAGLVTNAIFHVLTAGMALIAYMSVSVWQNLNVEKPMVYASAKQAGQEKIVINVSFYFFKVTALLGKPLPIKNLNIGHTWYLWVYVNWNFFTCYFVYIRISLISTKQKNLKPKIYPRKTEHNIRFKCMQIFWNRHSVRSLNMRLNEY